MHIKDMSMITTAPVDALSPNSAKAPDDTLLFKKSDMVYSRLFFFGLIKSLCPAKGDHHSNITRYDWQQVIGNPVLAVKYF